MSRAIHGWLAALLGAIVIVFAASGACRREPSPRETLRAAFAGRRPFEARFAEVPFGRWERPAAGISARIERHTASPDIVVASAMAEQALAGRTSAAHLKWAAMAQLLMGEVDAAVARLEQAAQLAPRDTNIASDLAAAYLVRADASHDGRDIARAIEAARRGIAVNSRHAGCWFNLALAVHRAGLLSMANDGFVQASRVESGAWADEAAARSRGAMPESREALVRALEPAVLTGDLVAIDRALPDETDVIEEILERRLLIQWAEAIRRANGDVMTRWQRRAHDVATRLTKVNGDRHPSDLVSYFDRCTSKCAAGWISHIEAMTAWDDERIADARRLNAAADDAFDTTPSVVNASRILLRVTLGRIDGRNNEVHEWVRAYHDYCARSGYLMVTGRVTWQMALLESEAGNFGGAVARYREAADWLMRARDREGAGMVDSLLAAKYQQLGDFPKAWAHALTATSRLNVCRELRRRAILAATAVLATADGLDEAAMAFRAPLIDAARRAGTAIYLARVLSEEAVTLVRIGRPVAARECLDEAAKNLERIDDPGAAALSRALVRTAQARVLAEQSPREAAAAYADAINIYRQRGNFFAMPVLELERGRAWLRTGAADEAERAFTSGIAAAERERQSSRLDVERVALLSERWDLYASLIDLKLTQHDESAAADLLDRARATNLLEAIGARTGSSSRPLPPDTVVLEYAMLPSGVHGWITVGGERHRFPIALTAPQLDARVEDYRRAIQRRDAPADLHRRSVDLSAALLGPVRARMSHAARLVIVPDGPLCALPFAALEDPATGSPLIDHATISVTPSLAVYRQVLADSTSKPAFDAVVVGNPTPANGDPAARPRLPGADREARAIAALYRRRYLIQGEGATRRSFLDAMSRGRVLHFAGHALVDTHDPSLSRLLVSPTANDSIGAVFVNDVSRQTLRDVRLVVLSACDTAGGRLSHGEGVVGLARAFLRAGAGAVIATLWPVDDVHAGELALAMHRELIRGRSTADALRVAQLKLRDNGADLLDWAAPIMLGRDLTITGGVLSTRSAMP